MPYGGVTRKALLPAALAYRNHLAPTSGGGVCRADPRDRLPSSRTWSTAISPSLRGVRVLQTEQARGCLVSSRYGAAPPVCILGVDAVYGRRVNPAIRSVLRSFTARPPIQDPGS
jgi:hypothetical protein